MPKKPITILGINPGTRYLGLAVFQGLELRDWRIKAIKGKWSNIKPHKFIKIITGLIDQYEINTLAIKKLHHSRSSKNLNCLEARIKDIATSKGLKVYQYSISDIKRLLLPDEKINKQKMIELIASKYPALSHEYEKEQSNTNSYHVRMFEAVALGLVCFNQLDKNYK